VFLNVGAGKIGYMLFVDFRYVWESKADGALAISEDTWNEPLGRGTEIRLQIRDEAGEYLEDKNLKVSVFNCWMDNVLVNHFVLFAAFVSGV
jgi:hypothetical protein